MVTLENIEPGMVLAANLVDKSGRLLLGKGVEIQDKHILIFRTWGIIEANILGDYGTTAPPLPDNISQETLDQARKLLLPQYLHTDIEHPAIAELLRLAAIHKATHDE